jgi:acylphosphatase
VDWCPGKDSNLHGLHRWYLKPVRLPIPPPGPGALHSLRRPRLSMRGFGLDRRTPRQGPRNSHARSKGIDPNSCRRSGKSSRPTGRGAFELSSKLRRFPQRAQPSRRLRVILTASLRRRWNAPILSGCAATPWTCRSHISIITRLPRALVNPSMSAEFIEVQVFAEGRVQGVGYRDFVRRSAERFGVSGWVRNRHGGSVEACLLGPRGQVDAVIAEMRRGPRSAEVANLRIETAQPNGSAMDGFAVRSTI